jgi:YD repeat-containing protein
LTDKHGNWQEYDSEGILLSFGTPAGVIGKLIYQELLTTDGKGAKGRATGLTDRNDTQVIWYDYDSQGRLWKAWDRDNRSVEYFYSNGRLTKVKDPLGQETSYEYDSQGRIVRSVDSGGRPNIIAYDPYGGVASVVDRFGKGHFFDYDFDEAKSESYAEIRTSSGRIEEIWYDRDGHTRRVDVNGRTLKKIVKDGRSHIITDEKGNITRKDYDEWDNLTRVIYADGSSVSFEYDLRFNKVKKVTDLNGNVATLEYDERGNLLRKVDAVGTEVERTTLFTYDEWGQLLTAAIDGDSSTDSATSRFTYDERGNLATMTDPEGNTTEFLKYNAMGKLLEMKDPRGNLWKFEYDAIGRLISQTDPLENKTSYEYDGANNRTAVINALLKRFDFEYDDHNNLIKATDPYAKYVTVDYNSDSLPVRLADQEGRQSIGEYDNEGRPRKTKDGAGNETLYHYDETHAMFGSSLGVQILSYDDTRFGSSYLPAQIDFPTYSRRLYYDRLQRLVNIRDYSSKVEYTHFSGIDVLSPAYIRSFAYDKAGNVHSETDAQGKFTEYAYDALNRLVRITDPLKGVVERSYDKRGNLRAVKDPNQGLTRYDYDRNNRLVRVVNPMGEETLYQYDAMGNRTAVYDAKGQKISYEYDAVSRLIKVRHFAAGNHSSPVKTVDLNYNNLGHLIAYDDGTTSAAYTYDDLQRKISESVNYGSFTKTTAYAYYANGLKKSFTDPGGVTTEYRYDGNNRLAAVDIPGQGQITYSTYRWNSPTRILLPGGSTQEYGYDPLNGGHISMIDFVLILTWQANGVKS